MRTCLGCRRIHQAQDHRGGEQPVIGVVGHHGQHPQAWIAHITETGDLAVEIMLRPSLEQHDPLMARGAQPVDGLQFAQPVADLHHAWKGAVARHLELRSIESGWVQQRQDRQIGIGVPQIGCQIGAEGQKAAAEWTRCLPERGGKEGFRADLGLAPVWRAEGNVQDTGPVALDRQGAVRGVCCRRGQDRIIRVSAAFRPSVLPCEQDMCPAEGRDVGEEAG